MHTDPLAEFLKDHGAVKDAKDVGAWLKKHCTEEGVLRKLVEDGTLTGHVSDWKKFVKGLGDVIKNPWGKEEHGEKPEDLLLVRERIWSAMGGVARDDYDKMLGGADVREARRHGYAVWALWMHPWNKSKMYLPVGNVVTFAHKWKLDIEEVFKCIRKHHAVSGVYLSSDLSAAEGNISAFLKKATVLGHKVKASDKLDAHQNAAIANMLACPFSALHGGAGVGKSSVTAALIKGLLDSAEPPMVFCLAFTHKAKKCIADKLRGYGLEEGDFLKVSTIHSFIATYKGEGNLVPRCLVLVDEASMVDVELLGDLGWTVMSKNVAGYQLGFIGDWMQLPPVTRGEFFRQLVGSGLPCVNKMTVCYRAENADLYDAYEAVREGRMPRSSEHCTITLVDTDRDINSAVGRMIKTMDLERVQFIAWQNKDVYKLNKWAQEALLKAGKVGPEEWRGFYRGDRVIYRGENTETLTNAMTGVVKKVLPKGMIVDWAGYGEVQHGGSKKSGDDDGKVKDIQLSFCFTGHASQGDEYDTVVIACYDIEKMIKCLDRRWFYVGLTRGKKRVYVVATKNLAEFIAAPIKSAPLTGVVIQSAPT
jgi:hypothetical protein